MRPGDGQLSLFEVDAVDQPQNTRAVSPSARASIDRDKVSQVARATRAANEAPEADAARRSPSARPGTDPGGSRSAERVPDRRPRRASSVSGSLLSPDDVARRCGLSRKAIYRAVARGELRAARILSRLRIDPGDVEAWLQANAVDPHSPALAAATARLPATTGLRRLLPEQ